MIKVAFCSFLLLLCCANRSLAQVATPHPADEVRLRPMLLVTVPLHERAELVAHGQLQFGSDLQTLVSRRTGGHLQLRLGSRVRLSPGYLVYLSRSAAGRTEAEHRPHLAAHLHLLALRRLTLTHRSMIERRLRPTADATRYRTGLYAGHPVRLGRVELRLLASGELFYDWNAGGWVRNQFSTGLSTSFGHVSSTFYYLRQGNFPARAQDVHVLGTTVNLHL